MIAAGILLAGALGALIALGARPQPERRPVRVESRDRNRRR